MGIKAYGMKASQGFILVTVLLIVSLLMLITLSQWQSVLLYQRMMRQYWHQQDMRHALESVIQYQWAHYRDQVISVQSGQQSWQGIQVGYQLVSQGIFPCIHLMYLGHMNSTHHVEMKTWVWDEPSIYLKVRFVQPMPLMPCPATQVRLVADQIVSWQYVTE